jgi:hypothetical protein
MGVADRYELAKRLKRMASAHVSMEAGDPDWNIVMLFYSSLHATSAYMMCVGQGAPANHTDMTSAIRARQELGGQFLLAYDALKRFGWNVRYNAGFSMTAANKHVAFDRFRIVTVFVEPAIRQVLGLAPGSDLWP